MKYLTLGTVLAKVACHTGTIIVIYFIRASCIVFARIRVTIIDIWEIKIHVKHGKFSTPNRGYFCKVKVWFTRKKIHFTIVIDHCVSSLRQLKGRVHDKKKLSSLLTGEMGRSVIELTLGTVLALVARHTGTCIIIYFVVTSCTVFARIRAAIIDIWQTKIIVEHWKFFTRNEVIRVKPKFLLLKKIILPSF